MPDNQTTYTINFEAQYKSLKELQNELNKIIKNSDIKLNLSGKKDLNILTASLNSLIDKVKEFSKDGKEQLNLEQYSQISTLMSALIKKVDIFKKDLASATLSQELSDQLNKVQQKINQIQQQSKELTKNRNSLGKSWGITLENVNTAEPKQISKSQKERTFAQVVGEFPTVGDEVINSYARLEEKYKQIDKTVKNLTEDQNNIIKVYKETNQALDQGLQNAIAEFQTFTNKIKDSKNEIVKLQQEYKNIQTGGLAASSNTVDTQQSIQNITNISDTITTTSVTLDERAVSLQQQYNRQVELTNSLIANNNKNLSQNNQNLNINNSTLGRAVKNVVTYGTALRTVRSIYTQFINTIRDMDKALTSMTVVTQLSREQAWKLCGTLQDLGKITGTTATEIANITTMYLQQGKTMSDALELTKAAAMGAKIAGISGAESVNLLTNAMNGFQMKASQALEVSDKFAALAASAATNYSELATALSKVAAQANLAGMSMDFTLGMLTKGIETTREAPETIGTALKTVISRMRELTDYGETLEDGVDVNRVDKALKNIGVALLDDNREFRSLEDVLTEVGEKWNTLNKNQQANVAVALAGTRQQSRLIAMMQDWDRTEQLVSISMQSAGTTMAQHRKYMQGLEAATNNLTTSYQSLITSFTNSDTAINVLNTISSALNFLSKHMGIVYAAMGAGLTILASSIQLKMTESYLDAEKALQQQKYNELLREQQKIELEKQIGVQNTTEDTRAQLAAEQEHLIATKQSEQATIEDTIANLENDKSKQQSIVTDNQKVNSELAEAEAEMQSTQATREKTLAQLRLQLAYADAAEDTQLAIELENQIATVEGERAKTADELTRIHNAQADAQERINKANKKIAKTDAQLNDLAERKTKITEELSKATETLNKIKLLQNLLGEVEGAGQKKTLVQKIALIAATKLQNKLGEKNAAVTFLQTVAQKGLNAAIKANPFVLLVSIIVAIVVAMIALSKKNKELKEQFDNIKETLSDLFQKVMAALKPIFDIITKILTSLVNVFVPVIKAISSILETIGNVLSILITILEPIFSLLTKIGDAIAWIVNLIGSVQGAILNWFSGLFSGFANWLQQFESAEKKAERIAARIKERQDAIYENKQRTNTLKPLIDEYTELSQKTTKTVEELERLKEIESEIGDLDESYKDSNGNILWDKVSQDYKTKSQQIIDDLQANFNDALTGLQLGIVKEEFKQGLTDYYDDLILQSVKAGNLTIKAAKNASNDLKNIFDNLTDDELLKLAKDKDGLNKIQAGVVQVQKTIDESDNKLIDGIEAYLQVLDTIPESAKQGFESVYAYYTKINNLLQGLTETEKKVVITRIGEIGLNEASLDSIQKQFTNTIERLDGESDKAYAQRVQKSFDNWVSKALANSENKSQAVLNLLRGQKDQGLINAIIDNLTQTNQQALEAYTKKTTAIQNIKEASQKAKVGLLTNEELRKLAEENEELFSDEEWFKNFMQGEADLNKIRQETNEELRETLQLQIDIANQQLERSDLTEDQRQNYNMQKNLAEQQLENLKYEQFYSSQIWENYKEQTSLQTLLLKQADKLAELEQQRKQTSEDRTKILEDELKIYAEQHKINQDLLKDETYLKAKKLGIVKIGTDGTVIFDAEAATKAIKAGELTENEQDIIFNHYQEWGDAQIRENNIVKALQDLLQEEFDDRKKALNKLKSIYSDYFSKLDELEQEQERQQSQESIARQLSALSGGSDTATLALRKNLLEQLSDLNKQEAEARKQLVRDSLQENISKKVEDIDKTLEVIKNQVNVDDLLKYFDQMNLNYKNFKLITDKDGNYQLVQYAQGGMVDYTGLAWVDGTKAAPEAFLNAEQTQLISSLVRGLAYKATNYENEGSSNSITIGEINISTPSLNTEQDFKTAGQIFAEEFGAAIRQRGINVNVKR